MAVAGQFPVLSMFTKLSLPTRGFRFFWFKTCDAACSWGNAQHPSLSGINDVAAWAVR